MDIRSEPVYEERPITLLDFQHTFGQISTCTLREADGDSYTVDKSTIVVARKGLGIMYVERAHLLWWGDRQSVERVEVTPPIRTNTRSRQR